MKFICRKSKGLSDELKRCGDLCLGGGGAERRPRGHALQHLLVPQLLLQQLQPAQRLLHTGYVAVKNDNRVPDPNNRCSKPIIGV
jgi:hypothetical protein